MNNELRDAFSKATKAVSQDGTYRGTLGKLDPATGAVTFAVPGRPQWVYVLIQQGYAQTLVDAINRDCPYIYQLPVIVTRDDAGMRQVRIDSMRAAAFLGISGPPLGVAFHSHRLGTGLEDVLEGERFQPGMIHLKSGMNVTIEGFYYDNGKGVQTWFPKTDVDLTSYVPSTAGFCAWAKIGFVQADGSVVVVKSTEKSARSLLTDALLAATQLTGGARALGGVALQYGETAVANQADIRDAREHVTERPRVARAMMFHHTALKVSGAGTLTTYSNLVNQLFNFETEFVAANNGDKFSNAFELDAGTYTFFVDGMTNWNEGKIDWAVDDVNIATGQDWYSASIAYTVRKTAASISIPTSGWHKLTGTVNGMNASSSGYAIRLTDYGFLPAAD